MADTKQRKTVARKKANDHEVLTGEVLAGEDLPLVTIRGSKRPRARLQLGENGKIYLVTKPKDMFFADLADRVQDLSSLAEEENPATERVAQALSTLEEFVTCVFAAEDHAEVQAHLRSNGNNEEVQNLADGMRQLFAIWAPPPDKK